MIDPADIEETPCTICGGDLATPCEACEAERDTLPPATRALIDKWDAFIEQCHRMGQVNLERIALDIDGLQDVTISTIGYGGYCIQPSDPFNGHDEGAYSIAADLSLNLEGTRQPIQVSYTAALKCIADYRKRKGYDKPKEDEHEATQTEML